MTVERYKNRAKIQRFGLNLEHNASPEDYPKAILNLLDKVKGEIVKHVEEFRVLEDDAVLVVEVYRVDGSKVAKTKTPDEDSFLNNYKGRRTNEKQ